MQPGNNCKKNCRTCNRKPLLEQGRSPPQILLQELFDTVYCLLTGVVVKIRDVDARVTAMKSARVWRWVPFACCLLLKSKCLGGRVCKFLRFFLIFPLSMVCAGFLWMGCVVKDKPSIDALACTKTGACVAPYKCFDVPQQGPLCLTNGAGLEPYSGPTEPILDSGTQEELTTEHPEVSTEPVSEEPSPEPVSDGGSDTQPEENSNEQADGHETTVTEAISSAEEDHQETTSEE